MRWAGDASQGNDFRQVDYQQLREQSLDALAATVEQHFDWQKLALALDSFSGLQNQSRQ
jgi:cobyric acid synthase